MPLTWSTLVGVTAKEKKAIADIQVVKNQKGAEALYMHLGVAKSIQVVLKGILSRTFEDGKFPSKPHLFLELWTDGVELHETGIQRHLWPVCFRVVSVGESMDGPRFLVPPHASRPLMATFFLGSSKPTHGNILIDDFVAEMIVLNPKLELKKKPERTNITADAWDADFTASLVRVLADTPARALLKGIFGHTSTFFCEKCDARFESIRGEGVRVYPCQCGNPRRKEEFLTYANHVKKVCASSFSFHHK